MARKPAVGLTPILALVVLLVLAAAGTHHDHGAAPGFDDRACPACASAARTLPAPTCCGAAEPVVIGRACVEDQRVPGDPGFVSRASSRAPPRAA
jgi:hypothetical protein